MACLNNNFGLIGKSESKILLREDVCEDAELVVWCEFMPPVENVGNNDVCESPAIKIYSEVLRKGTSHTWSNGAYTIGIAYFRDDKGEDMRTYKTKSGIECYEFKTKSCIMIHPKISKEKLLSLTFINFQVKPLTTA